MHSPSPTNPRPNGHVARLASPNESAIRNALIRAGLTPRQGYSNPIYTRVFVSRPSLPYWHGKGKRAELRYAGTEDVGHVDVYADGYFLWASRYTRLGDVLTQVRNERAKGGAS